jgi:hypothetical protein
MGERHQYHIESVAYETAGEVGADVRKESPCLGMHAVNELQTQQQGTTAEHDSKTTPAHAAIAKRCAAERGKRQGLLKAGEGAKVVVRWLVDHATTFVDRS